MVGARPQFIKAAALSLEFSCQPGIEEIVVHTGQHYDKNMSEIFFRELNLPKPKYTLVKPDGNNAIMISHTLSELTKIIEYEKPNFILVYGDTDSTLAGAIAANKNGIRLIHVEAGLRSFDLNMPEEVNRKLTDNVADILFTTDDIATKNLQNEGCNAYTVEAGDIMLETLNLVKPLLKKRTPNDYALVTLHRKSNVENEKNLTEIAKAISVIAENRRIIFPVHPRTKERIVSVLTQFHCNQENLQLINPVGYIEMMELLLNSNFVITDSGGLQKEAVALQKPCVVLRTETEWKLLEKQNQLVTLDEITAQNILKKMAFNFNDNVTISDNIAKPSTIICKEILKFHSEVSA